MHLALYFLKRKLSSNKKRCFHVKYPCVLTGVAEIFKTRKMNNFGGQGETLSKIKTIHKSHQLPSNGIEQLWVERNLD